jgi:putative transposase
MEKIMLNDKELQVYVSQLSIPEAGIREILRVRKLSPSKNVMGNKKSITISYPSQMMGYAVQAQAKTTEFPEILLREYDPDTFENHPQPPAIKLPAYLSLNGRKVSPFHTSDFFQLRKYGAGWVECKLEADLELLAQEQPGRYQFDEELKIWRCPPGEALAHPLGLFYEIRSEASFNWTFIRNVRFFEDYLRIERTPVNELIKQDLQQYVKKDEGCSLIELFLDFQKISSDDVYALIAAGDIYIDMDKELILEPDKTILYSSFEIAQIYVQNHQVHQSRPNAEKIHIHIGGRLIWKNTVYTVINIDEGMYYLSTDKGDIFPIKEDSLFTLIAQDKIIDINPSSDNEKEDRISEILAHADKKALIEAYNRYQAIKPILRGEKRISQCEQPERTLRDWIRRYKDAEIVLGRGYFGLFDKYYLCGNYEPKLPPDVLKITQAYADSYSSSENLSKKLVYGALLNELEKEGLPSPSIKTFNNKINLTPEHEQVAAREGERAAYPLIPKYEYLSYGIPKHGDTFLEFGHSDHSQMGIELKHSKTGKVLGKPWISIFMDAYTRMVLAFILSFYSPSYRTNMTLLRLVGYRFHRFPKSVVTDQGKDFQSIYYQSLLASYRSEQWMRRAANPHDGDIMERLFGITERDVIFNFEGNTQIMKNVRKVTKSRNPKLHAAWTLPGLYIALNNWFDLYNNAEHATIGMSPVEASTLSILDHGSRDHTYIVLNDNFEKLTMPEVPRSPLTVHHYGIESDNDRYNSTAIQAALGKKIEVRADPFRPGLVYGLVNKLWVPAKSSNYSHFKDRSEPEITAAADELRRQNGNRPDYKVTAARLATFISSARGQSFLEPIHDVMHEEKATIAIATQLVKSSQPEAELDQLSTPSTEFDNTPEINGIEAEDPWKKPLQNEPLDRF